MKKILAIFVSVAATLPLAAQTRSRYLISMERRPSAASLPLVADADQSATHAVRKFTNLNLVAADLTNDEVAALRKSADVRYISPVVPRYVDGTFKTPLDFGATSVVRRASEGHHQEVQTVWYGIDLVHARDIWQFTRGNIGNVNVAVIDTGIDYNHPELKDRYKGGYNVYTQTNDPKDDHGHGTHVCGIVAADDNNIGVVGVAPLANVWVAKVLKADGSGTDETVIAGLDWVMSKKKELGGNWIVSLSLGAEGSSDPEQEAFAQAIDDGILVIAAAGNTGMMDIEYPGRFDQVLAISAIDKDSKLAQFSSFGSGIAFAAPGVDVLSTVPVGTGRDLEINQGSNSFTAYTLVGTQDGSVQGTAVYCGYGSKAEIPASVKGNIAIVRRGNQIPFHEKAQNAIEAGAVGVIIADNGPDDMVQWTLLQTCAACPADPSLSSYPWGVVLSVNRADGDQLIANAGQMVQLNNTPDDYAVMSGTSMATPHATGVAALVWSLAPAMTAADMRLALKLSADDIGAPGYDIAFGYGRIDALSSAKYVAPQLFGLPPTQPPVPTRRRPADHH